MRVLTLDVGNTTVDVCIFEKDIKHIGRFSHKDIFKLSGNYERVICCSVKKSLNEKIRSFFRNVEFINKEEIPVRIHYKTPETLGVDRVLLAYGVKEFYSLNAVIVSIGTATVVDLLLEGEFMGGFISAGIRTKLKALSEKAEGIPEFELKDIHMDIGKSTEECVVGGVIRETESFIEQIKKLWEEKFNKKLKLIITGGDGEMLRLKEAVYDPLLIHRAMLRLKGLV